MKKRIAGQAAAIAFVTFIAYSGSFEGGFVSDDVVSVRDNLLLRSLDWVRIKAIFTSFDDANYIPIKVLSLAIDYNLWGAGPIGFHVTNLLIHIFCALLVYLILMRLGLPEVPSCLASIIWAIHPLQVESVAWISERKNVLSGLFFFLAFYLYLSFSEKGRARTYLALVALFALATLSKMNTMVLPVLCLAYETTFRFRLRLRDLLASLPLAGIGAAVGWYNLSGNPIHGTSYHGGRPLVTWLSSAVVVFRYLGNFLCPTQLCVAYDVPLRDSLLDPPVLLSVLGLLLTGALAWWAWRSRRREGFWILWFGITLAPMLNIIPFRSLMNDRYMYLAILGPIGLAAFLLRDVSRSRFAKAASVGLAMMAAGACAILSLIRVGVFRSELSLYEDWALRLAAVASYQRVIQPGYEAKVAFLQTALARDGSRAAAHSNLGALYFEAGRTEEAIPELETAARLAPGCAPILSNLGRAYVRSGDLQKARLALREAVRRAPYDFMGHVNLARVYLRLADTAGARHELGACARIRPGAEDAAYLEPERRYLERLEHAQAPGSGSPPS